MFDTNELVELYFERVDPVYPMIHRQSLYMVYRHFWLKSTKEKHAADSAFVILTFVVLALGTPFTTHSPHVRKGTAEFFASASNQTLRVGSFPSSTSILSMQAMVSITYFLTNMLRAAGRLPVYC